MRSTVRSLLGAGYAIVAAIMLLLRGYLAPAADAAAGPHPAQLQPGMSRKSGRPILSRGSGRTIPSGLPLSKDVKYTENNQVHRHKRRILEDRRGPRDKYAHIWADPEFDQVAMMGTMREAGSPILMNLRLRVELGRITRNRKLFSSSPAAAVRG